MKRKHKTEFEFDGEDLSYDEVEQLWTAVQSAGKDCTVTIYQVRNDDRPYGYTNTSITVEV